jgi:hypothetical protein
MQAIEISKVDYQPSDMDILYAEGISLSNSLTSMEFSFPKSSREESLPLEYQHDSSLRSVLSFHAVLHKLLDNGFMFWCRSVFLKNTRNSDLGRDIMVLDVSAVQCDHKLRLHQH